MGDWDATRAEKIRHWKIAEEKTLALLALLGDRLSKQDHSSVTGFVDANEYGLAFEQLVLAVLEENGSLSRKQCSEIEALYQFLGGKLDQVDNAMIADLRNLVGK